ncbi:MAG TPA: HNH endonuclease, partial [Opitutales bacterium]|nr:HNH endonuclease [Opitutales bacterium]
IKVSRKGIQGFKKKIDDAIRNVAHQVSIAARIHRATKVIRGWGEYYRIAHNYSSVAGDMDNYAHLSMLKAICRKMDIHTAKCYREYHAQNTFHYRKEVFLGKLSDKKLKLDFRGPKPYEPGGLNTCETDMELEVEVHNRGELKRSGNWDLKLDQLDRDGHQCQECGRPVQAHTSDLHHIKPVHTFPNVEAANRLDNLQILCLECHKAKHAPAQEDKK